jgi:ribonuclease HII
MRGKVSPMTRQARGAYKATFRTHPYKRKGRVVRTRPVPGVHFERSLRESGAEVIAGIDEVGVGAWAGPVVVGAVISNPGSRVYKVRDSKLLDAARREWLAERVRDRSLAWGVGVSWPNEIDEEGLSEAIRRAASRALDALSIEPDACLVDGKWNFIGDGARMVVKGDCESVSIASASLVAKVFRDRLMADLAPLYPGYGFDLNKGYPSPAHKWALAAFGPSSFHRRLFTPVRRLFEEGVPGRLLPEAR